jgi:hypothetical protein
VLVPTHQDLRSIRDGRDSICDDGWAGATYRRGAGDLALDRSRYPLTGWVPR